MTGNDGQHGEGKASAVAAGVAPGSLSALLVELARLPPADLGGAWDSWLRPGAVVGRFELVREIGRGGLGVVYEARDRELGRSVAFKAVRAGGTAAVREERLLREAETAARLSHPNIATLYDVGRTENGPYLVLELLRGETLEKRLGPGSIPVREALRVSVEIARGVAHAHAQGVIHRDLKPSNVFLCKDGQVKVLDFGLAHAFGQRRADGGTPSSMAPEQWKGAPEDERTDVFALGVMLYRMLAGEPPFPEDDAGKAVQSARRAPTLEVPEEPALGELVGRMLEKEPTLRPRDGGAVLAALAAFDKELERSPGLPSAPVRIRRRWPWRLVVLVVGGALLGTGVAVVTVRLSAPPPSIAVLPFADLSPGKDQEYLADGVTEEILNALSRVEGLRVAGRTSSFSFKGRSVEIREIGRRLNVRTVLEGSLRKEGNRVRITAEVVDVGDGYRVWSETYSRELTGIFAVQDDIARAVVEALKVKLAPGRGLGGSEGRTANPDSYTYYLLGLHHLRQGTLEGARRSRAALEKALALDPGNAAAQAALAMAILQLYNVGEASMPVEVAKDLWRQALAAAEKAVAMAPNLADGYRGRGFLRLAALDWAGARADIDRALALSPTDPHTLRVYGQLLATLGRVTEGIALLRRVGELDPLWGAPWDLLARLYLASGQLSLARSACDRSIEIVPDNPWAQQRQVEIRLLEGQPEAALSAARRIADPALRLQGTALAENDLDHVTESDRALEELTSKYAHDYQFQIAQVHAWRGDSDRAFEWLERAYRERDPAFTLLKFDALLRKIRGDPRYAALLKKVNLPSD